MKVSAIVPAKEFRRLGIRKKLIVTRKVSGRWPHDKQAEQFQMVKKRIEEAKN